MKYLINFYALILFNVGFAQNVIINKVVKSGSNTDKFFYKINPDSVKSEYLGEIEIQGFSANDTAMFDLIYKKAKSVGANAFAYKPFSSIDGNFAPFDPSRYRLSLYEVNRDELPKQSSLLYIVSSSDKMQKISFDHKFLELPPRSFYKRKINAGETYPLSTRYFLGSSIKIQANENEGRQFFQMSSFKVKSNPYGTAGINLKSGDILKLEKSFGDFLTIIYTEIK